MRIIAAILFAVSAARGADCNRLNFSSLPSAQGWILSTNRPSSPLVRAIETNAFAVDGTKLVINTVGQETAAYGLFGLTVSNQPFTLTFRARVLETIGDYHNFYVGLSGGWRSSWYYFGVRTNSVLLQSDIHLIDATQFHTYRLEGIMGGMARWYVDDVVMVEDIPIDYDNGNVVYFGSTYGNRAEITQLDFCVRRGPAISPRIACSGSCIEVCWDSLTNRFYQVHYRSSLTTNQWAPFGMPVNGNGEKICLTDTVQGRPTRFYRVVEF